ncbi:MAG TPA: cytochrome P460 family protein [Planctomycetota bacterium]|nr:cytochrome P460 family protein [Planctomycetota bacterium]
MQSFRIVLVCFLLSVPLWAGEASAAKGETAVNDPAFHARLLEIAGEYLGYGRVDDQHRWAPYLCKMAWSVPRMSAADEGAPHAQKLYFIFAKDRKAYLALKSEPGQVVVKESWTPKEVPANTKQDFIEEKAVLPKELPKDIPDEQIPHFDTWSRFAKKGEKLYHAENKAGLFIMFKLDSKTPETDKGWVYGTVNFDGKTVTSAGRVASCMGCHVEAKNDRLFGLPDPPKR